MNKHTQFSMHTNASVSAKVDLLSALAEDAVNVHRKKKIYIHIINAFIST